MSRSLEQFFSMMALIFIAACTGIGFWMIVRFAWQLWKGLCV